MKYRWSAIFENSEIIQTPDGEDEHFYRIKKAGTIESEDGTSVVFAVLNNLRKLGNLVEFELGAV